jgi:hypothetical protein
MLMTREITRTRTARETIDWIAISPLTRALTLLEVSGRIDRSPVALGRAVLGPINSAAPAPTRWGRHGIRLQSPTSGDA